ncbi:hypothetical protein [Cyanothece sp. BG0011]|uniref:hypothetical protein n=1 Tax=Cyanothece sp. BG0011 TaxID=2082950 RepID=UPI000D1F4541
MRYLIPTILSFWIGAIITLLIGVITKAIFDYTLLWFDFILLGGILASTMLTAYLLYFDNPVASQLNAVSKIMVDHGFNYSDWCKVEKQIKDQNIIQATVNLPNSDSSKLQNNRAQITLLLSQSYPEFQFTLTFPTKVALLRLKRKT